MKGLRDKKRQEISLRDGLRVCLSKNNILIEDFYPSKDNPYAVYDYNGNLLETNDAMELFAEVVQNRIPHWRIVRQMWWGI